VLDNRRVEGFGVTAIGAVIDVDPRLSRQPSQLNRPSALPWQRPANRLKPFEQVSLAHRN
jgi:hypothetical protein